MTSENFRETIQPFCISVEGFPSDTDETQVRQIFPSCLRLESVLGAQLQQTKWLICFRDRREADHYLNLKEIKIRTNLTLKISVCILCDIPTSWEKIDLKSLVNPVIIPQINPAEFPPNYSPHGVAPGNHGYHPGYQNPAYAGYGAGPPMHPPPMYPYGGQQQMPSQMGSMPSEGGDYISYPGISTPPGHQGPHPIQGQGQEGKSPAVVEGEGHEQPEVTSGTHLPQEQSPVPGTPVQSPDGRIGQDKQEKQDETYSSMPPYLGYPYQGPGYHMHYPPTQYTPRFPGRHPLGHPPPYSQFPRQPASNSPVRMAQPHNVPNYPLPADQTPDTEMESSENGAAVETAEEEPNNIIKVTGISSQTSEENLILFFENKRKSGGGEIETIDFQGDWAIIAFEDSEVVDSVLQKSPLILDKKQVTVERFVPQRDTPGNSGENIEEEEEPLGMIKVSGFSSQTTEETLEMFFENKRKSGGGDIEEMDFQGDYAIITFVNPEVVDSVLQKSPLILDKKQVTVERFIPQKDTPGNSGENIEEEEEPLGMIKVSGFSSQTTEDTLEMFFENKRKSGGGDIEEMDFQEDFAIITFVNSEVVDRILQKLPLLLDNKQIKVERFVPERSSTGAASVEETRPSCTIEVRGINSETSVDTLENYFGNKKAAGKTVEVVRVDDSERDEQGVVYITYETKEVMNAVLSRRHKLDGATLEVAEYIPPPPPKPRPMYADKVLIKGKSPNTTKDGLENFLEAKTGITPKHVLHGEEEDVVLVTFEEPPDFEKLEKACMKKALDKNYLKVFKVPISNCVLVRGTAEKTTASTLEYYFENTRRSGGGDVLEVKDREDGSFLILFVDHTVVDRVLERSHTVDNTTLDVKLFHELLGESGDDGPKFKVPDTLVISDIDPRKVQFLQNSKPNKDGLEKQLSSQHTQIIWPENLGDPVKLECLLTKEIKDCRTLAKAWKDTARLALDRFLDVLSVFKHDILQEAWGSVIGELQNMNISHPDGVSVAVEKVSYEIFVMGHKKFAAEVSQSVEKIIKVIVDELERKKKQISETTRALKHYQVMMLSKTNYKETVEKKYRGMKVILDFKARTVTYEGLYGEVNEAKANLFETISALVSSEVNDFSKGKYKYLQEKAVKQYVAGKMKDKNITAVWEMQNSKFLVFAMSDEGAVNAAHILKDSILETSVDVKKESLPLLATEKWSDEEQNIKGACTVLVYISVLRDKPCILIYATDVDAEMVRERVSDFLINNTIYDTKLPLGTGIIRFLQSHCVREIQDIEQRHKLDQVTININNLGLEIKGTEVGLSKAKQDVNAVISQVARKEHVLRKPGITKLMTSEDSKPKVSQVEKIHGVVIVPSDESDDDVTGAGPMPLRPDHTQEMARCSQPGYELMVVMGDITNLKVDVLVNAANRELQHNGGLAKAIVQKGGNAIQDDCNRYIRQNRALMEGDVYMGKAGSLQCNYIAHAVGPKWQGGRQREKELLTEAVLKCLEETNIYQQTSIALPALGAGVFGYPAAKSTQTIVDAIDEFFKDNPRNTIQNIYLCDVSQNNVDLFVKALRKFYGQRSVIIADATGGARDKWSAQKAKPRKGWKNVTPEPDMPPSYPEAPVEINITITLVKGQIANQKVDMIVNTCSKDLKLSNGAVSSSLLAAAGPQMQAECDQNYQGIQFGEIAVTQGYNLQCHCVCHGSLPSWDGGASALVVLQKFMLACLREATQQGYESVAFPAMGTGNLSYPRDTVAREMYKIVSKYSTQNPTSPVRNVMFVIYDKDLPTVKAFEDAEKSQGKAHKPTWSS
ncbi:protein mono-ADP-ribosyltransferase PARP14-like isoform X2 [Argopecten irradians]|uniref:protein mono-ADP-ribosyltransferase PARP14-like isoform X2 n=1 Tax=Argopecten irradians TaxID=31199 RepID=UPI003717C21D